MLKIGLDLGTGFVKCVSDYGSIRFPSVYVKRIHGSWAGKSTEAVGSDALHMIDTMGASAVKPINRGRPDPKYSRQVELLVKETMRQIYKSAKTAADTDEKISIVAGLPYHAFDHRESITRIIKRTLNVEQCIVVAQASGTLVDLGRSDGMAVSIGQGTTEIIVIEDYEVIDGESSQWASDFVTRKIGKFAHLDVKKLCQNTDTCKKYSKILAENLAREVTEMAANYGNKHPIALSGGGLLLSGMNKELAAGLKGFKLLIPDDPVMSNARGLYKIAE